MSTVDTPKQSTFCQDLSFCRSFGEVSSNHVPQTGKRKALKSQPICSVQSASSNSDASSQRPARAQASIAAP